MRWWIVVVSLIVLLVPQRVFLQEVSVSISEVMWAGSDLSTADEWVEITGVGGVGRRSLNGWTLTYRQSSGDVKDIVTFSSVSLGSGETIVVSNYDEQNSRLSITPDIVTTAVSLPNTKLFVQLKTETGMIIDTVDDYVGAPFAGSNASPKASMERIDLSGSGGLNSNWSTATTFRGFDDGAMLFGTPGYPNFQGPSSDTFAPEEATNLFSYIDSGSLVVSWTPSISLDVSSQIVTFSPSLSDGTLTGVLVASDTSYTTSSVDEDTTYEVTLRSRDTLGNTSTGVTVESSTLPDIRITEVLSNPIGADSEEWIEIANLGSESVDISGWILDEGNSPDIFVIPFARTLSGAFPPKEAEPFILSAGEHVSFRKSVTGLPLGNQGEEVTITWGTLLIDSLTYVETAEEVSFGRDPDIQDTLRAFCVPSEGKKNAIALLDPLIDIQSPDGYALGTTDISASDSLSINVQAVVLTGSLSSATCFWNYSDGYTSSSCNPPSHTFSDPGSHSIRMEADTFCGNEIEKTLSISLADSDSAQADAQSTVTVSSGGGGGGRRGVTRFDCPKDISEGIIITEFIPNPFGADRNDPDTILSAPQESGEWIEIWNSLGQDVSLCGWELDDSDGGSTPFSLDRKEIPAGEYLILPIKETGIALNNSDDSVRLLFNGEVKDEVRYSDPPEGESYARTRDDTFVWSTMPTPGLIHTVLVSDVDTHEVEGPVQPDGASFAPLGPLVISEVYAVPHKGEEEWVEIYNRGDTAIDPNGWVLDDVLEGGSKPWTITGANIIKPNAFLVVHKNSSRIQFNNTGDDVCLVSPAGEIFDFIQYPKMKHGSSYARAMSIHRILDRFCVTDSPTLLSNNRCPEVVSTIVPQNTKIVPTKREKARTKKVFKRTDTLFPGMRVRYRNVLARSLPMEQLQRSVFFREEEGVHSSLYSSLLIRSHIDRTESTSNTKGGGMKEKEVFILVLSLFTSIFLLSFRHKSV